MDRRKYITFRHVRMQTVCFNFLMAKKQEEKMHYAIKKLESNTTAIAHEKERGKEVSLPE